MNWRLAILMVLAAFGLSRCAKTQDATVTLIPSITLNACGDTTCMK